MAKNQNRLKQKTNKKAIANLSIIIVLIVVFIGNSFIPLYPLRMLIVFIMALFFLVYIFIELIKNSKTKKVAKVLFCIIIVMLMIIYSYQAYKMVNDLVKGPQEAVITNISVKSRTTSGKYRTTYHYIIGKVNGEEVQLKIVKNWKEVMDEAQKFKKAKVSYYKNANSIATIEFIK